MYGHNGFLGMNSMGYFMQGGGVMFILLIVIVAFLIFYFIKNNQNSIKDDGALDLLKKRFANGEISEDEYLTKKEILSKQ